MTNELTDEQYLRMLKKLQALIKDGLELELDDSNEIGNKHTHTSWGQCTEKHWDEDSLFRKDAPFLGSKRHGKGQFCPFDKKGKGAKSPDGCFYRCRLFQDGLTNRTEALRLYEITITKFEGE